MKEEKMMKDSIGILVIIIAIIVAMVCGANIGSNSMLSTMREKACVDGGYEFVEYNEQIDRIIATRNNEVFALKFRTSVVETSPVSDQ